MAEDESSGSDFNFDFSAWLAGMQRQGGAERGQQGGNFENIVHDFNRSMNLLNGGTVRMWCLVDDALPILDPLDRQFLELDRVCLFRYFHFLPSKSDANFRSPLADEISGGSSPWRCLEIMAKGVV